MSNLRNKIIRLAHQKPELRKDLLPLLTEKVASPFKDYLHGESGGWEIMWNPKTSDLQLGWYGDWYNLPKGGLTKGKNVLVHKGNMDAEVPPIVVEYDAPMIRIRGGKGQKNRVVSLAKLT